MCEINIELEGNVLDLIGDGIHWAFAALEIVRKREVMEEKIIESRERALVWAANR